ncbi:MAG TPA: tetratricopeptide repeat protein [Caulobacteraceae bacterium]|nr:tetratricopeptide repeat protein [Caulobacteraceae bacterium]
MTARDNAPADRRIRLYRRGLILAGAAAVSIAMAACNQPAQAPNATAAAPSASQAAGPSAAGTPTVAQSACDKLAAPPVPLAQQTQPAAAVDWNQAIAVCTKAVSESPAQPRFEAELGRAYQNTKNYFEAAHHYRIAADAGSPQGEEALGVAYYSGLGVVKNNSTAFDLFSRAAAAGNPYAMANLGAMYGNGDFVPRDDAKALDWFDRAIAAGDAGALTQVGIAFFYGHGAPVDYPMAAQYFQQAADLNDGYALKFLAVMYERGLLGPADPAKAASLRDRAQLVDPQSATPSVPLPRAVTQHRYASRAGYASGGGRGASGEALPDDPNANNQFYTGSVAVNHWHHIATRLPRCWPICSLKQ